MTNTGTDSKRWGIERKKTTSKNKQILTPPFRADLRIGERMVA